MRAMEVAQKGYKISIPSGFHDLARPKLTISWVDNSLLSSPPGLNDILRALPASSSMILCLERDDKNKKEGFEIARGSSKCFRIKVKS